MNGSIFYFTGTGNSLAAAEKLASILDISEIIPMAGALHNGDPACSKDVAGFVFPLYYWGLPEIVERFLAEVNLEKCSYIFAIVTRSGSKGKVFDDMKKIMNEKGKNLNAGFYLTMPGNYIPMYDVGSEDKQRQKLEKASDKLNKIAETILENRNDVDPEGVFLKAMSSIIHTRWKQKVHKKDVLFSLKQNCTSCERCSRVCPVDNIRMVNGRPVWLHHCQECMACIHACPVEAIQFGRKTEGRRRYHHPDISWEKIAEQKKPL